MLDASPMKKMVWELLSPKKGRLHINSFFNMTGQGVLI